MIEKYTEPRAQITRAREEGQEKHRRNLCVQSERKRAKIGAKKVRYDIYFSQTATRPSCGAAKTSWGVAT